jgi:hypothetical protein
VDIIISVVCLVLVFILGIMPDTNSLVPGGARDVFAQS